MTAVVVLVAVLAMLVETQTPSASAPSSAPARSSASARFLIGESKAAKDQALRALQASWAATPGRVPGPAESRYMTSTKPARARSTGCGFGRRAATDKTLRDAIVILDFGRPMRHRNIFGSTLFGRRFRSTGAIEHAAEAYAQGYWDCIHSVRAHLVLALGTSNWGPQVSYGHGASWASMVNDASRWVAERGYAQWVAVAGASDIEMGWNTPRQSRRWVDGYDSVARHPYYDFGDAGGCPPAGACLGTWRLEDVWYVAWGAPGALPLPEVYNGTMAAQWQRLSLYAEMHHGEALTIVGVVSQRGACSQARACWGMNISPHRAWKLLSGALNGDPRTAQWVPWSTDIRWGA